MKVAHARTAVVAKCPKSYDWRHMYVQGLANWDYLKLILADLSVQDKLHSTNGSSIWSMSMLPALLDAVVIVMWRFAALHTTRNNAPAQHTPATDTKAANGLILLSLKVGRIWV